MNVEGQLFRQETLNHQNEQFWGQCVDLHSPPLSHLTCLFTIFFLAGTGFLTTGDYARKEMVPGVLVSDLGAVQIRAPAAGIVEELYKRQGDRVGKGESLLLFRSGTATLAGEEVGIKLLRENARQETLLRQQIQDSREAFRIKQQQLESQLGSLELKGMQLESLAGNEEMVAGLLEQRFERLLELHDRGYISEADLDTSRAELLQQNNRQRQAVLELEDNAQSMLRTREEIILLSLESDREISRLENDLAELQKQNLRISAEQSVELVSPVSGTVSVIHKFQGQNVLQQQAMVSLIQEGSTLEAELYVPSRAIGFIKQDLEVKLRLDAYPYQKFGIRHATVRQISRTVLPPDDERSGISPSEPYYRVTASLQPDGGQHFDLRPGMRINADILLESRSLFEWLFEPLFLLRGRS